MYYETAGQVEPERELVILLGKGNESAFEKLYRIYHIRILRKLILILKDEEIAKEVLQDIFLTVWEKRLSIDPDKSFRSYLFRIAENRMVDVFRKAARDKRLADHLVNTSPLLSCNTEERVVFKESDAILQKAIESLPPQRKKIFVLCRMEGKTYEEVGSLLGISTGTINDHMVKAIRTIKSYYAKSADIAILLFIALMS